MESQHTYSKLGNDGIYDTSDNRDKIKDIPRIFEILLNSRQIPNIMSMFSFNLLPGVITNR